MRAFAELGAVIHAPKHRAGIGIPSREDAGDAQRKQSAISQRGVGLGALAVGLAAAALLERFGVAIAPLRFAVVQVETPDDFITLWRACT